MYDVFTLFFIHIIYKKINHTAGNKFLTSKSRFRSKMGIISL